MGQTTFSGPVKSDNGFIENSFTTAERDAIADPAVGLMIYNTTTNTYQVYGNSGWQEAFAPPAPSSVTYVSGVDFTSAYFGGMGTTGTVVVTAADTEMATAIQALNVGSTIVQVSSEGPQLTANGTVTSAPTYNARFNQWNIQVENDVSFVGDQFATLTF